MVAVVVPTSRQPKRRRDGRTHNGSLSRFLMLTSPNSCTKRWIARNANGVDQPDRMLEYKQPFAIASPGTEVSAAHLIFLWSESMNDQPAEPGSGIDLESISLLIPKTRQGDSAAREELLRQIQDYLDLMAARYMDHSLRPKAGASDVVQQTLTQVVEHFDDFQGATAAEFRGWLKTIVINEMRRMQRTFRAGKRDIARERGLQNNRSSIGDFLSPEDSNPTPSSEAMAAEQIEHFYLILGQLPPDYAEVIRLRSIERLPFQEIAQQMDRSHDSVTKLWYRAVLKFEEMLRDSGEFTSGS